MHRDWVTDSLPRPERETEEAWVHLCTDHCGNEVIREGGPARVADRVVVAAAIVTDGVQEGFDDAGRLAGGVEACVCEEGEPEDPILVSVEAAPRSIALHEGL